MNKDFYLQSTDVEKEKFSGRQINFEWNITYSCNYRCPHCIFNGKWEEYGTRTIYLGVHDWVKHWKRIFDLYGRVSILITGGEPFTYPEFIPIIKALSEMHYPINISTNASGNMELFAKSVDPSKVSVSFSFQPGFNEIDEVLRKTIDLKKNGFQTGFINLCAYPPYLDKLDVYVNKAKAIGETLKIVPFYGIYSGKCYPEGYNAQERMLLGLDGTWENNVKRKGKLCAAGYRSALIYPDGKVARCGQIGERVLLGNILSDNFALFDKPSLCDVEYCPCLEGSLVEESGA